MIIKEDDIIKSLERFFSNPPEGVLGIGDDAAILPTGGDEKYVISTDQLVENIHFRMRYGDPESLAHKSLHVNLSDMAAMGARPAFILLGLAVPTTIDSSWLWRFSEAFAKEARAQNVFLIGGDVTASPHDIFICLTIIGRAPNTSIKYRRCAKVGDVICVVGALGEAHAGLMLLEKNISGFETIKNKSLQPTALVAEGLWLGAQPHVTAMMDVSDGLYTDLGRLAEKSRVGADLYLETLQPSESLAAVCAKLETAPMESMLAGGEDYALLFTVSAKAFEGVTKSFAMKFGYALKKIGVITASADIRLTQNGVAVPFSHRVFSHFGER